MRVDRVFEAPTEALRRLATRELDAVIFVGGVPVPAFEKLDASFHFVQIPSNSLLEQIYQRKKSQLPPTPGPGRFETYAVPSVIMTRERVDRERATALQKLVTAVLVNKETLDLKGHPKWKSSFVRSTIANVGYRPTRGGDFASPSSGLDSGFSPPALAVGLQGTDPRVLIRKSLGPSFRYLKAALL